MNYYLEVLFIGFVLSADSFSAALAMGFRPHNQKDVLKFASASGLAEAFSAFAGALAGTKLVGLFGPIAPWVSFLLLSGVAAHMAYEGVSDYFSHQDRVTPVCFHSFYKVLIVSFATSLDALAVGVGLGVANKSLGAFIFSIGVWAFLATVVGMAVARKISCKWGPFFNLFGSFILFILAVKLLSF